MDIVLFCFCRAHAISTAETQTVEEMLCLLRFFVCLFFAFPAAVKGVTAWSEQHGNQINEAFPALGVITLGGGVETDQNVNHVK